LQLYTHSLLANHILCFFIEAKLNLPSIQHTLSLNSLTRQQCEHIKGYIINMNNQYNEVFPSFDSLDPKFSPGQRIIDILIVISLFIYSANTITRISSCKFNNLIIWPLNLQVLYLMYLLSWMLVSRARLPSPFYTSIFITNLLSKCFTMP